MSTGITAPFFLQHFTDPTTNKPVSGGTVEYYVGGSTNIPKVVYADIALTNSLGNVLTLDAGGYAPQYYMLSGFYKIVLRRSNGSLVYTRDYIEGSSSGDAEDAHKVKATSSDTTPNYLGSKIHDSSTLTWSIGNPGANEYLSASVNFAGWADAYKVKTMGSDTAGYLKDKIASSSQITKLTDIDGVISFELDHDATTKPSGLAGGDLTGTYPDPLLKELSGLGTSYSPIPALMAGTSTPLQFSGSGGRGIAFKAVRGYGLAIDSNGYCYATPDGGLTWRKTTYAITQTDLGADIAYGKYDGTNYGWVFCEGRNYSIKYLPDVPASYDANGVPLQSAWVPVDNTTYLSWADITWNDVKGYWLATGNNYNLLRRANLTTGDWEVIKSDSLVYGGVTVTNTGRTITFIRDSGQVFYSDNINTALGSITWTEIKNGTTAILDYASGTTDGVWGSAIYGNGMVAFTDYKAGLIVTTTDITDPDAYQLSVKTNSLPGIYDITFDGANWYATNGGTTTPAVYQIFIGAIPAHRQFVAEDGEVVLGDLTLPEIANAPYLGTDAWGNIISKSAPNHNPNGYGYSCTMQVANATTILAPNLIGLRNELTVLFVPFTDMNVTHNLSMFGCFLSQGGTGTMTFTLRDDQYRLIAASSSISDPSPSVFLELVCALVQDPITQATLNSYTLKMGNRYNLGISWTANGIQLLGDETNQNTNITPYPAYKVDNVTGGLIYQLTGGGESKLRPFIRLVTKA